MDAESLPHAIYAKALNLGIGKITLAFEGGSDQGYLDISFDNGVHEDFNQEVETWAWEVYDYSGAGDGSSYGDQIEYDLKEREIHMWEWTMERSDRDLGSIPMVLLDEGDSPTDEPDEDLPPLPVFAPLPHLFP
jgi:hypothetical protein